MLSKKFKNEFVNNSNWLRIGFHWPSIKVGKDVAYESILTYFDRFQSAVLNFADSSFLSDTLRLHFFWGPDMIMNYLNKKGINTFLTADDNRVSYNLSKNEDEIMHRIGVFHKHGIQYRPSTARLERFSSLGICKKIAAVHNVVLFTHECFLLKQTIRGYIKDFVINRKIEPNIYNRYKFEKAIRWLYNNNYKFIL